jgi:hypothetical protein
MVVSIPDPVLNMVHVTRIHYSDGDNGSQYFDEQTPSHWAYGEGKPTEPGR